MLKRLLFAAALSAILGSALAADFDQCRQIFANGVPPVMPAEPDMLARPLCFSAFAVMYSGKSRTPIYVAERLNKEVLLEAQNNQRTNKFFADARLPSNERAELDDYRNSGFDRGHMAPAGDMGTAEALAQSFSLANVVPQYPINNQRSWAGIEKATRKYVMRAAGDVFVITGPASDGVPPTIGSNGVWVPQHLFKLVYDPSTNRSWAHWLDNSDDAKVGKPISYEELVIRTGIQFLPDLH